MADLDSQPKSIQSMYAWFSENKLLVNRRYQRKLVWTQEEKQKFVESILRKLPVPAILLAEREPGAYEIIDGLQRLHTLMSFIETAFPTLDGKYFDVGQFPTAHGRAEQGYFTPTSGPTISHREVSTFLDYALAISVMRGATEAEIDDVFARINTYGHRLSDQERRQAGVQDDFSHLIRTIACELRGDASSDMLQLSNMPSISIDLPKTKHGYGVAADEVFWVTEGVLRSTDLRDSMDEQCLADIAACIIGGQLIERSKDALDAIYEDDNPENARIAAALAAYGADKFASELKYCIDQLLKVCQVGGSGKLRNLLFDRPSTNPFPAVFAILLIALHESIVGQRKTIASYVDTKRALTGLYGRIDTGRGSTAPDERRMNIDTVKGLIASYLVATDIQDIYGAQSTTDIDSAIRRSEIELPHYELKQGLLRLDNDRTLDPEVLEKVIRTVCAISNNGKDRAGQVIIGVTDSPNDVTKITQVDGTQPRRVGGRFAVGVRREATVLGETVEQYFARWKNALKNSRLSEPLRTSVLSNVDFNDYYGLGIIVITVPPQTQLSYLDDDVYWREGDETRKAISAPEIARIAQRFS